MEQFYQSGTGRSRTSSGRERNKVPSLELFRPKSGGITPPPLNDKMNFLFTMFTPVTTPPPSRYIVYRSTFFFIIDI